MKKSRERAVEFVNRDQFDDIGEVLMRPAHVSDSARQMNLFYKPDTARDDRVSSVMDTINREFGRRTVQFAAEGLSTPWSTRFDSRSPRYTTNWDELMQVG